MAKIPLAQGQEQLRVQAPAARRQPGVFSTAMARAQQSLAQTITAVAKQFEDAQALAEKTNASTEALRKLKELNLEAGSARTIQDISKFRSDYPNRISKIREESTKTITSSEAKNEFGRTFDKDKLAFDFSIRSTLQKNQNGALETILNESMLEHRDSYITAEREDETTRYTSKTNRNLSWQDAVSRGIVTAKFAGEQIAKQNKEWDLARMDVATERDAVLFLADVREGEKGIYADVDAGNRLAKETKAITKSEKNKKIAKRNANERHTKNEVDLTKRFFADQPIVDEIQNQLMADDISPKYAGVLDSASTSPDAEDATTVDAKYSSLITDYLNLNESDLDALRKFRIKVIGFHAAGMLSRDDAEFLFNKTVDPFTQKKVEGKGFLAAGIDMIKNWASNAIEPELTATKMINKFINRVDEKTSEEEIVKAGQDIIKEQIKEDNPDVGVLADTPNSIYDNRRGFDNVSNQPSQAETEWEFRDGKLVRIETKKPVKKETKPKEK